MKSRASDINLGLSRRIHSAVIIGLIIRVIIIVMFFLIQNVTFGNLKGSIPDSMYAISALPLNGFFKLI